MTLYFRTQGPNDGQLFLESLKGIAEDDRRVLSLPFILAVLSALTLLARTLAHYTPKSNPQVHEIDSNALVVGLDRREGMISRNGGVVVFLFMVTRIVACVALVGLSAVPIFYAYPLESPQGEQGHLSSGRIDASVFLANIYALLLASIAVLNSQWRVSLLRHNIAILSSEFAVLAYRDLWPFATYDKQPLDRSEGWTLWVKIALLFLTAVLIPVCIPNVYIPVDPKNPAKEVHPEQTASWLSFHSYNYLTPMIVAASKVPHLPASQLPPVADYDRAKRLSDHARSYLDPAELRSGRHGVMTGLIRLFGFEFFKGVIIAMTLYSITQFAAPLAINRLLTALQTDTKDTTAVRPWFWIIIMLLAPILGSMAYQFFIISMTHGLANAESILTQLVFDQSLKIRIKAETSGDQRDVETPGSTGEETGPSGSASQQVKAKSPRNARNTSSFIGRLNNLVTIDMNNITGARNLVSVLWLSPLQLIGCSIFLYVLLGWSSFVGLGLMIILLPVPGYMTTVLQGIQEERMKKTDNRTQAVSETMGVLRMIKMFGWERKTQERIDQRREEELVVVWRYMILELIIGMVAFVIPIITMLATYATATIIMKIELTSATVFSSIVLFDTIRAELHGLSSGTLTEYVKARVSVGRMNSFFRDTELLDAFEDTESDGPTPTSLSGDVIGFRNACFAWSREAVGGESTPSSQFRLTVPGDLQFLKGKVNLIVGPTGAGKTSLLMALLGEMHFTPTHPDSGFNLPRAGGVALSVQESWVLNETIRDNILFHSPYDEVRYKKVLNQCALEQDLELFEAGDLTEVGERGLTLSGGQKARLTLARAIYSKAEIILLDDVLAALDVHTAVWVVNKCLKGDLVQGRTVLLVTHNIALASPIASFIISVSPEGVATSCGNDIAAALTSEPTLKREFEQDEAATEMDCEVIDAPAAAAPKKANGKLILAEEIKAGKVGWKANKLLFKSLGGNHPLFFFTVWIGVTFFEYIARSFNTWFLGYWSSQYSKYPTSEVPVVRYLWMYTGLTFIVVAAFLLRDTWFIRGRIRASKTLHKMLLESILGTTLRWLDETPVSRIITRMTMDIGSVDGPLMQTVANVQRLFLALIVSLVSAVLFVPLFTLPALCISAVGVWLATMFHKAQMSVKRESSNAKAPMLAQFGAAMAGLVSLRAYGAQDAYREELRKRIDHYVRVSRMRWDLNRWMNFRMHSLGAIFTALLATYLTYTSNVSAANIGFSLNAAVRFCTALLWSVRSLNYFQVEANSLERISAYIEIDQEPKPTENGKPPAAWPTSGEIRAENLTARYSKTGPAVLHNLSFSIGAGERIGVVGRTGSGKSSLTLALLRCILTDGSVYFDGLLTSEINLDALRSNITIIPQMPELLSGTLRYNLDPFNEYDDATLNSALKSSGLYASMGDAGETDRLGLDSNIATGGLNVSVGQRQIIALARAIVRSSKLLILDEATSAIDHDTDNIIQNTLRRELGSDVTVLTVAHRLQTIIDADRIMVLDAGQIVEFASPAELLLRPKSAFKALVDESGEKDRLYEIAKSRAKP
ncbi:multidrug resistance-associated ABC transporter [Ephemerocybe angulata]|uniref:Multidrug resistance-associated ABC transporter n=1 Tax=Ephemerocybe angulata TaxID=980116 RepID=A0A8H6HIX3_9AGAR|nr:multidrug resistance-associated ABC transporter [Tulosesus angulatus]